MALQDLLNLSQTRKKMGMSEERIQQILPIIRKYIAFWREYPDLYIDFLVNGNPHKEKNDKEEQEGKFEFYFYQRVFLRSVMRYQYVYAVFPRRVCAGNNSNIIEEPI